MKDDRGELDLSALIDEHKKELWKWKMKESEWIKTQNQLDGTKKIVEELARSNVSLKKENQELQNEMALLKGIGNNSPEMKELQRDNKYLAKQVEDYREILRKAGL
tara:strand:+ start:366 stop:683 length:318 start_codon:yes stop_codon:yes gene_type:complete